MGSKNQGQGHETTFKQMLNEKLGLDPSDMHYIDGDTDLVAFGIGTNGSRSTVIGGTALVDGRRQGHRQGQEASPPICSKRPTPTSNSPTATSRSPAPTDGISITEVARASFQAGRLPPGLEGGLYETGTFAPDDNTYPNGCHVCEVEIDPDTGAVEIVRYVVSTMSARWSTRSA